MSASVLKHPWWIAFSLLGNSARYLDEWLIVELSYAIRQKPEWERKYKDPTILAKWKLEFLALNPKTKHAEEVFDYAAEELKWYENLQAEVGRGFQFGPDDKILYSDAAVLEKDEKEFMDLASKFESSITEKDYHPGLDNLVVDLVHPSLYHLVYNRTKIVKNGKLETAQFEEAIKAVKKGVADYGVSQKFQWLPALMKLDDEKQFTFSSYINNLHPLKNAELYGSIAKIFNLAVPAINMSLARYQSDEYVRIPTAYFGEYYTEGYDKYEEKLEDLIDEGADEEEFEAWEKGKRAYYREFKPKYDKEPETKPFELRDLENLKVIVKLANIELTPEKPEYKGGSWHVEGTINEDIVATVLYYYDMDNIEESRLSFKYAFEDPHYDQGDECYCEDFYGIKNEDNMTRMIGNVVAQKGRITVFTNSFQHHVDAFKLKDATKPGYRKILCFFLVDPYNTEVKATDVVPFQNEKWVNDKVLMEKYFPGVDAKELATMTEMEAKEYRDELMAERKVIIEDNEDYENAYTRLFFLCEH